MERVWRQYIKTLKREKRWQFCKDLAKTFLGLIITAVFFLEMVFIFQNK